MKPGDLAYLPAEDEAALVTKRTLSSTRKYPMVMSFTEGDPLDEEVRVELPRPPQPSVNRTRLRLGIDYGGSLDHGSAGLTSTQVGFSTRVSATETTSSSATTRGSGASGLSEVALILSSRIISFIPSVSPELRPPSR